MASSTLKRKIQTVLAAPGSILSSQKPFVLDLTLVSTNRCTQNCPMCNSALQHQQNPTTITLKEFKQYVKILDSYHIPVCPISGGEPTLVPEMPEIIEHAVVHFPFGVSLLSNFHGSKSRISRVMETALRNNVNICASFDGFGEVADQLRRGKNVSDRVTANIEMVSKMRKELGSSSIMTLHTVISDLNLHQIPEILAFSKTLGWTQSIAPVNDFAYLSEDEWRPVLTYSRDLLKTCKLLLEQSHLSQLHSFVRKIPEYSRKRASKYCPYLTRVLKTYKLFLEPNGDISLCDRVPIGNVKEKPLYKMFNGTSYKERLQSFRDCEGCWMACFVELFLAIRPENLVRFDFLNRILPALKSDNSS